MRISIPDDYQNCIRSLDASSMLHGHDVTILHEYFADPKKLSIQLNDPEALVLTRTRTPITDYLLDLLPNLKVISQTGKNSGHIDVQACEERGIAILEGKGNPIATAELTWALIMNGLRLIPQAIQGLQNGKWQTNIGRRVHGKTIGIWGYGRIGKKIAHYAKAFSAELIVWGSEESRQKAKQDGYTAAESVNAFFMQCDVVSIHLRLNEATKGIVKREYLRLMKPDALLVNTARAAIIERGAILEALREGNPGFAAFDVFEDEPIYDPTHPLLNMPNVICTPHVGYVEKESYELYFGIAFRNLIDWMKDNEYG